MQQKRYHLIIDVEKVEPKLLTDKVALEVFLKEMPGHIGMHVLSGPNVVSGIPENPGISGFVIIDYSHISIHTFTEYNEALVDIFSCKPFAKEKAIAVVLSHFQVPAQQARVKEVFWG